MKKRLIVTLLVSLLLAGSVLAESGEAPQQEGNLTDLITPLTALSLADPIGLQVGEALTVGSPSAMSGYFALDLWGNNTADIDVRNLLHGYSTVAWLADGGLMFNGGAVAAVSVAGDIAGNRTYTFTLKPGLTYNEGTPITAKDYLFSLLLTASPEVEALGGTPRGLAHFLGYGAYQRGEASGISGIRLLSADSFSLTVDGTYLPYFYGLALLEITPYPMHVIAPGCDILDAGNGAYIGRGGGAAINAEGLGFTPGVFSAEMLRKTLLDPETGYVFNPRVTSGPYTLESYDKTENAASFVINENYIGNYEGQKPHVPRIVFKHVAYADMVAALTSGEVDLLNKVMDADTVTALLAAAYDPESSIATPANYPRSGLAYLALACEEGVTADVAVRQAIARCIDKDALLADLSQYAMAVNGYYGLGQWVTSYAADEDTEKGLAAIDTRDEIEALRIPYDLDEAKAILQDAGWAFDAAGEAYTEGVRHRKEANGSLTPLILRWAKPTDSAQTTDLIRAHLEPALQQAGIALEVTEMAFTDMLPYFYREKTRTYDMFFLGSNFQDVFDPYYDFHTADMYQGTVNTSGLRDVELMMLAWEMRTTPATEQQDYALKWLAFQQRFMEIMPIIPLYSNVYFDFYANDLRDYDVAQATSWSLSIPYTWIGEPPEFTGEEMAEEGGFYF